MSENQKVFVAESTDGNGNSCFELVMEEPVSADTVKKIIGRNDLTLVKAEFRFTTGKPDDDVRKARQWLATRISDLKDILTVKK